MTEHVYAVQVRLRGGHWKTVHEGGSVTEATRIATMAVVHRYPVTAIRTIRFEPDWPGTEVLHEWTLESEECK